MLFVAEVFAVLAAGAVCFEGLLTAELRIALNYKSKLSPSPAPQVTSSFTCHPPSHLLFLEVTTSSKEVKPLHLGFTVSSSTQKGVWGLVAVTMDLRSHCGLGQMEHACGQGLGFGSQGQRGSAAEGEG